jgi:hypothetical protein
MAFVAELEDASSAFEERGGGSLRGNSAPGQRF